MPRHCVVSIVLIILLVAEQGRPNGADVNYEQLALEEVARTYWGPDLFLGACDSIRFDSKVPLMIYAEAPAYRITLLDVPTVAGLDLRRAAEAEGRMDEIAREGVAEEGLLSLELSKFPFMKRTNLAEPSDAWRPSEGYLLRFSNRLRYRGHTYLQVWIKAGRYTSGARIEFAFDPSGKLRSAKWSGACDDLGSHWIPALLLAAEAG